MPTYDDHLSYGDASAYGAWAPPASTLDDVWRRYSHWYTRPDDPVRDGLAEGIRRLAIESGSAIARMSVLHLRAHALGWCLDLVGAGQGMPRNPGERDDEYRERLAVLEDVVSRTAIVAAVNALLPPDRPCRHALPATDGCFAGRHFAGRPRPDRPDLGVVRVWGGADVVARFHLDLPRLISETYCFATTGRPTLGFAGRAFLPRTLYTRLYPRIAATLDRIVGDGIRWTADLNPTL